jgi:hypothetical protein
VVVIGAGRVGGALAALAAAAHAPCALVDRDSGWEVLDGAGGVPVLVATRNDDLEGVVDRVPAHRRGDLVFVQNGMLRPWLREHALASATRGLLFFAVPARGAPLEPGPPSPFVGPRAAAVVAWLGAIGVPAHETDWARFSAAELEKLVWNGAFGLLCQRFDADVGTVCDAHADTLDALVRELSRVCRASLGVEVPHAWLLDRLIAYSRTIPTYQGAVKEWRWRNGWFDAAARRYGLETPLHRKLLAEVGLADRLSVA